MSRQEAQTSTFRVTVGEEQKRGRPAPAKGKEVAHGKKSLNKGQKVKVSKGKGRGKQRKNGPYSGGHVKGVMTLGRLIPDSVEVVLPWTTSGVLRNVGLAFASLRFQMNGLWDPDPLLGGLSALGLSQWAGLYAYYRPVEAKYTLRLCNQESFAMMVYLYATNGDPGGTVGTSGATLAINQFGKSRMLSPVAGGSATAVLSGRVPFAALLGDQEDLLSDDNYRGITTSANPQDLFYIGFNTDGLGTIQTAAGCAYELVLEIRTILYDRQGIA